MVNHSIAVTRAPVITIDGPAASGKGTIAQHTAKTLSFFYLDSGKIYRAVALAAREEKIDLDDEKTLAELIRQLAGDQNRLHQLKQQPALLTPAVGQAASKLALNQHLRQLLIPLQRSMQHPPGLVADGRDMATVVFPDAVVKVFLTADLQTRAQRRLLQLRNSGIYAKIEAVCADLEQRDQRDFHRAAAPLKPAVGALRIDSTTQSIGDIVETILRAYHDVVSC